MEKNRDTDTLTHVRTHGVHAYVYWLTGWKIQNTWRLGQNVFGEQQKKDKWVRENEDADTKAN